MNGKSIVLDTTIAHYLLNSDEKLATVLNRIKLYVSILIEIELLGYNGISKQDREKI